LLAPVFVAWIKLLVIVRLPEKHLQMPDITTALANLGGKG
jgi:hypothetical protein